MACELAHLRARILAEQPDDQTLRTGSGVTAEPRGRLVRGAEKGIVQAGHRFLRLAVLALDSRARRTWPASSSGQTVTVA